MPWKGRNVSPLDRRDVALDLLAYNDDDNDDNDDEKDDECDDNDDNDDADDNDNDIGFVVIGVNSERLAHKYNPKMGLFQKMISYWHSFSSSEMSSIWKNLTVGNISPWDVF